MTASAADIPEPEGADYVDWSSVWNIELSYEGTLFPDRVAELVEVTGGGVSARVEGRPVLVGKKSFLQAAGRENSF